MTVMMEMPINFSRSLHKQTKVISTVLQKPKREAPNICSCEYETCQCNVHYGWLT